MNIGTKIKEYRKSKGLTQKQLADKIGVAVNTISRYEIGERVPTLKIIYDIAEALSTDINNILDRDLTLAEALEERDIDIKKHPEKYEQIQHNGIVYTQLKNMKQDTIEKYDTLNSLGKTTANGIITYLSTQPEYTTPDEE